MPKIARTTINLSEKNTKNEILQAYNDLIQQVSEDEEISLDTESQKIIQNANTQTVEKVVNDLAQLKLSLNQTISDLTDKLTQEAQRFATLQKALAIAQKELADTQQIKVTANLLYRLIETHKQKETELEKEIQNKKLAWEVEQAEYETKIKRDRTREEEEYSYKQSLTKKRDEDIRNEEKRKIESEKETEKQAKVQLTQELETLRKQTSTFPQEMEKAIKQAVEQAIAETKKEAQTQQSFSKQQADGELKIADLKIASLEEAVKTQLSEITRLQKQLDEANKQVKEIAVAVIEGSAKDNQTKPDKQPLST